MAVVLLACPADDAVHADSSSAAGESDPDTTDADPTTTSWASSSSTIGPDTRATEPTTTDPDTGAGTETTGDLCGNGAIDDGEATTTTRAAARPFMLLSASRLQRLTN